MPTKQTKNKKATSPFAKFLKSLQPKVIKTYRVKPAWKAQFSEMIKMRKELHELHLEITKKNTALWNTIEKETKEKRGMRYDGKKTVIEVLEY